MNFSILKSKVFLTFLALCFSVILVGNTNAQSGTTGISGTVTDQYFGQFLDFRCL